MEGKEGEQREREEGRVGGRRRELVNFMTVEKCTEFYKESSKITDVLRHLRILLTTNY
jgi:hypothetical protein